MGEKNQQNHALNSTKEPIIGMVTKDKQKFNYMKHKMISG